ncbi:MAG: hypothetical protein FWD87_04370 [Spirochaetaceae bacterium]|nr:hypothetical protein [Spirochaetaceae bacterium]
MASKVRMLRKPVSLFLLLMISVFSLSGEEGIGDFYIEPRLRTWGLDVDFCLRLNNGLIESRDTILRLTLGGIVGGFGYYRDENDLYTDSRDLDYTFTRIDAKWGFGIEQGILWNNKTDKNLLSILLGYRAMRGWKFNMFNQNSILFDSIRPDKDGVLYNTFIASVIVDNTLFNRETGLRSGFHSELSAEIGPEWFFNDIIGIADFTRLFMNVKSFHPLYETKQQGRPITAIYLANSLGIDYVFGDNIPLPVRQTFGVQRATDGSGGRVRGFESGRFDGEVKVIGNFDIRFKMPRIKSQNGTEVLRPGFLAFFDVCYFDKLAGYNDNGLGVLMSTGFSLFSELFSFGTGVLTIGFPVIGERIDKSPVTIRLDYGLRF